MRIVLWDTRKLDVAKDFAGGYGVGQFPGGGGIGGRVVRHFFKRDYRPTALVFAYLAAIFRKLGHHVEYSLDRVPVGADVYIFNPSLITLPLERMAMSEALAATPGSRVLVTGPVAYSMGEAFDGLDVTIVRGEAEQLLWKFDDVMQSSERTVEVGKVADLDELPFPDWSPFSPGRFSIGFDFTKFPTGLVQQSRGCTLKCNYCPYIILENSTRLRSPEMVAAEMQRGIQLYGFRSFKFRDPLFGVDRKRVFRLAELIGSLPKKIEFSIESRIDLLRPDVLRALRDVGLTSITVGIETPSEETLRRYHRAPIRDDKQRDFVLLCRALGIRTVAGFMIGFPEDTERSIRTVLRYAKAVNPTFANFNVVTPYPGTEFFEEIREQIATFDTSKYTVYTPVLKYRYLTPEQVSELHAKCFLSYYFRGRWFWANAPLVWPRLQRMGWRLPPMPEPDQNVHVGPPKPHTSLPVVQPGKEDANRRVA
ncbi:MAG: radical SAM protein [Planctomycetota bacterium]|nr:MAG: radical SAM protein [Planctomycetota bacterium]